MTGAASLRVGVREHREAGYSAVTMGNKIIRACGPGRAGAVLGRGQIPSTVLAIEK